MKCIPQNAHERRRQFLQSLGRLAGFRYAIHSCLPDGATPDVVLCEPSKRGLFIGDAKDTESPGNIETQVRLLRYFKWFAVHLTCPDACGIFAVCFGNRSHQGAWLETLRFLCFEVGLECITFRTKGFRRGLYVAWCFRRPKLTQQATSSLPLGLGSP